MHPSKRTCSSPFDIRSSIVCAFVALFTFCLTSLVWSADPLPTATQLFNSDTQALVWIPNSNGFLDEWKKTSLGKLAADDQMKDFWQSQQQEIQDRFADAGWQLSLKVEDLSDIALGQTAIGWISRPDIKTKPYSLGIVVDVPTHEEQVKTLLDRIDQDMKSREAKKSTEQVEGVAVTHYLLPKLASDSVQRSTFYAVSHEQLFASDDLITIREMISAQIKPSDNQLGKSELYQQAQAQLVRGADAPEVEYFIRPVGFFRLLRSLAGKPPKNQVDMLKIIESQGFESIQCAAGMFQLSKETLDMHHSCFVLREKVVPPSVQILDFPNADDLTPPGWVNVETASVLGFSWNFSGAFPKFGGIVDAYIGGAGQFDEIIKGIRDDPNGPQIDIYKEVLPVIGTKFFVVTEIHPPITPDSKVSLICIELKDPDNKLPGILNRYSKSEPGSSIQDVDDFRLWRFKNDSDDEEQIEFGNDKADEDGGAGNGAPLLDEWAVSIINGYLVFSASTDLLLESIHRVQLQAGVSPFEKLQPVLDVRAAQADVADGEKICFSEVDLVDRSFEMQYELFRQGILRESRSLSSLILDRMLKKSKVQAQRILGNKLPPFQQVKDFFGPTGMTVHTTDNGWLIQGFILHR